MSTACPLKPLPGGYQLPPKPPVCVGFSGASGGDDPMVRFLNDVVTRIVTSCFECTLDQVPARQRLVKRWKKIVRDELDVMRDLDDWTLPPAIDGLHSLEPLPHPSAQERMLIRMSEKLEEAEMHLRARMFVLKATGLSSDTQDECRIDGAGQSDDAE